MGFLPNLERRGQCGRPGSRNSEPNVPPGVRWMPSEDQSAAAERRKLMTRGASPWEQNVAKRSPERATPDAPPEHGQFGTRRMYRNLYEGQRRTFALPGLR